jgi:hypothetical protein
VVQQHRLPHRKSQQLPGPDVGEGVGFVDVIGRFPRDELCMGGIRYRDREPELGRGDDEKLVKIESGEIRRLIVFGAPPCFTR